MHEIKKRVKKDGTVSYTACIRVKGYETMSATFAKKSNAQIWVQENESKMKLGKHIQPAESKKHTLNDLIERYKSCELKKRKSDIKKFEMHLNWWSKHIGKYQLSLITPDILVKCKEKLETEESPKPLNGRKTRTGATVNRYLATLSVVFSFACNEYGWLDENPMKKVRKNKESAYKDRYLMPDEIKKILEACKTFKLRTKNYNNETYIFVLIALSTGARYSEILHLKWKHIDFKNRQFYFMNTKNGENRGVPMTNDIYKELKAFQKVRNIRSDYLFVTQDGNKLIDMRVRFYEVLKVSKVKNLRFHDLRHTVASHIAMNGGSLLDIAQVTGHKTMQMVKRYSHLTQKHTAKLLESTTEIMLKEFKS